MKITRLFLCFVLLPCMPAFVLAGQLDDLPSNSPVDSDETGARPSYRYRVEAGNRLFLWRVTMQDDGMILEFNLDEEE